MPIARIYHLTIGPPEKEIYTIGHSTRGPGELEDLLRRHGVERVVDVRAHPGSRRLPQFGEAKLRESLAVCEIDYWHAAELGGRRRPVAGSPNDGWRKEAFRGYADHMASDEFERGLERLAALARERPTAIMCAEALWWRCHRRLIADALVARGLDVRHIMGPDTAPRHELTPFARVEGAKVTYPPLQASLEE